MLSGKSQNQLYITSIAIQDYLNNIVLNRMSHFCLNYYWKKIYRLVNNYYIVLIMKNNKIWIQITSFVLISFFNASLQGTVKKLDLDKGTEMFYYLLLNLSYCFNIYTIIIRRYKWLFLNVIQQLNRNYLVQRCFKNYINSIIDTFGCLDKRKYNTW